MTEHEWLESVDPVAMLKWLRGNHKPSDRKLRLFVCAIAIASPSHAQLANDGEVSSDAYQDRDWAVMADAWCRHVIRHKDIALPELSHILRDIVGNPWHPVTLPLGEPCKDCDGQGFGESCSCFMYHCGEWGDKDWKSKCPSLHRVQCERCPGTGQGPSPILTPLVVGLAQAAYDERQQPDGTLCPDRLAVLWDALEDAGMEQYVQCCKCGGRKGRISYRRCEHCNGTGCEKCDNDGGVEHWERCEMCEGEGRQPHPLRAALQSPGPHYRGCWAVDLLLGKE